MSSFINGVTQSTNTHSWTLQNSLYKLPLFVLLMKEQLIGGKLAPWGLFYHLYLHIVWIHNWDTFISWHLYIILCLWACNWEHLDLAPHSSPGKHMSVVNPFSGGQKWSCEKTCWKLLSFCYHCRFLPGEFGCSFNNTLHVKGIHQWVGHFHIVPAQREDRLGLSTLISPRKGFSSLNAFVIWQICEQWD